MRFFFSGELDSTVGDAYRAVRNKVETTLNDELLDKSYGDALETIAVIPMILGPRFVDGRKERRLIKHKDKTADYRLFINYNEFLSGSFTYRQRLLLENVIACVEDISRKLKGQFDGDRLLNDIRAAFPELFPSR